MIPNKSSVLIPVNNFALYGDLNLVEGSQGIVVFVHGSGSSRFSTRNQLVAEMLNRAYFSTLLFDLLTEEEEKIDTYSQEFRFNIPLLAERLVIVSKWLKNNEATSDQKLGYFGASTGAAAALIAAAELPNDVEAVVSRGGRPDMAHQYLGVVQAPTLLIVGELDYEVIPLNEYAYQQLRGEKKILIIPGATHLFEESGTLELAAQASADWFTTYLRPALI